MRVRRWGISALIAFFLAFVALAQPAAASPGASGDSDDLQTQMAGLLAANPGSKQIAENMIQFDNGVVIWKSTSDDVSTQALSDCPSGWQCGWTDTDYGPYGIRAQRCVYIDYTQYYFFVNGVADDFAYDVSSIFNNIPGVTWSQFWSPRNNANYNAHVGAPASYVGAKWNDSFTAAQGCVGDPA